MGDKRNRQLERAAALGDPDAKASLAQAAKREGRTLTFDISWVSEFRKQSNKTTSYFSLRANRNLERYLTHKQKRCKAKCRFCRRGIQ